jgi:hypothetical protein
MEGPVQTIAAYLDNLKLQIANDIRSSQIEDLPETLACDMIHAVKQILNCPLSVQQQDDAVNRMIADMNAQAKQDAHNHSLDARLSKLEADFGRFRQLQTDLNREFVKAKDNIIRLAELIGAKQA